MRRLARLGLSVLGMVAWVSCDAEPPPVGSLATAPASLELGYPDQVDLHLSWLPERRLDPPHARPRVFVHILDEPGSVVRTFDHLLSAPWHPDEPIEYDVSIFQSVLGPPLEPGRYLLTVGIYDPAGDRWNLRTEGEDLGGREYLVGEVMVPEDRGGVPGFSFSPSWGEIEGGGDLQILGRRRLSRRGEIVLRELAGPGRVRLQLSLPETGRAHSLVLDPGEDEPTVVIHSVCGADSTCVSGPGAHQIELAVDPAAEPATREGCALTFEANFHVLNGGGQETSLTLETLSWSSTH